MVSLMSDKIPYRYTSVLSSIKIAGESGLTDLTSDEFDFLSRPATWIGADRQRARRCIESIVFGSLDYCGLPRFQPPAEFIAGAILFFVHPRNYLLACSFMDGYTSAENVIVGIEKPVTARELFSIVIHCSTHRDDVINSQWSAYCNSGIAAVSQE